MNYNIALIPGTTLQDLALLASARLANHTSTEFRLDQRHYFTHLTLYMARLEAKQLQAVRESLGSVALSSSPLELEATSYNQHSGYVGVNYALSQSLGDLQERVVQAINPLRSGLPPEQTEQIKTAKGLMLGNLRMYGFARVGENYNPHLTLTKTKDTQKLPLDVLLEPPATFSGQFPGLGLFEMGNFGTSNALVDSFELGA